jgi:hypothetical protein
VRKLTLAQLEAVVKALEPLDPHCSPALRIAYAKLVEGLQQKRVSEAKRVLARARRTFSYE